MSEQRNLTRQIDDYILDLFSHEDDALKLALQDMAAHGLPAINVSANEGKLLYLLTKLSGAKRALEIGTLGGYSSIWIGRGLPADGNLLSLEYEEKHAKVARANIARAGLSDKIEVRVGAALDTLPQIEASGEHPFDLFFIDADKNNYPAYLDWCIKLARPGSVILGDNLIRGGRVINPPSDDESAKGAAIFNRKMAQHPRLESIVLPIMRDSIDGLGIAIVK
jgi:predicted O-methyltransferase YrrM